MNAVTIGLKTLANEQRIVLSGEGLRPTTYEVGTLLAFCQDSARYTYPTKRTVEECVAESLAMDVKFARPTEWAWVNEPGHVLCNCDCMARRKAMEPKVAVQLGERVLIEGLAGVWEIVKPGRWVGPKVRLVAE